jgi:hypothetical protein
MPVIPVDKMVDKKRMVRKRGPRIKRGADPKKSVINGRCVGLSKQYLFAGYTKS